MLLLFEIHQCLIILCPRFIQILYLFVVKDFIDLCCIMCPNKQYAANGTEVWFGITCTLVAVPNFVGVLLLNTS